MLSDHGQTQGATFKQRNGYGLDELVERSLGARVGHGRRRRRRAARDGRATPSTRRPATSAKKRREERRLRPRRRRARLGQPRPRLPDGGAAPAHARGDRRAPPATCCRALREHPHIGWLLVRSERARRGRARARPARATSTRTASRARTRSRRSRRRAARHLLRTDGFAHVADIMVGSFYDPALDEGCAFEELISFHGGLGGPQTAAFILQPAAPAAAGRADHRRRRGARAAPRLALDAPGRAGERIHLGLALRSLRPERLLPTRVRAPRARGGRCGAAGPATSSRTGAT